MPQRAAHLKFARPFFARPFFARPFPGAGRHPASRRLLAAASLALAAWSLAPWLLAGAAAGDTPPLGQVAAAPMPGGDRAESLALDYAIYLGGLQVLAGEARLSVDGTRYAMQLDGRTAGITSLFYDWGFAASSLGTLDREAGGAGQAAATAVPGAPPTIRPEAHRTERIRRNRDKTILMEYRANGDIAVQVAPNPEEADRVPPDERAGTLDPLSAAMVLMTRMAAGGDCSVELPVYDGGRVYDATFEPLGPTVLAPSGYNAYAGPAEHCRLTLRSRSQPEPDADSDSRAAAGTGPGGRDRVSDIVVWLAPVEPGGVPVPVRLEARRGSGSAIMHLSAVRRVAEPPRPPDQAVR